MEPTYHKTNKITVLVMNEHIFYYWKKWHIFLLKIKLQITESSLGLELDELCSHASTIYNQIVYFIFA